MGPVDIERSSEGFRCDSSLLLGLAAKTTIPPRRPSAVSTGRGLVVLDLGGRRHLGGVSAVTGQDDSFGGKVDTTDSKSVPKGYRFESDNE